MTNKVKLRQDIQAKRIEREQIDLDLENMERELSMLDSGYSVGDVLKSKANGGWRFKVKSPGPKGMQGILTRPFTILPSKYDQWEKEENGRSRGPDRRES